MKKLSILAGLMLATGSMMAQTVFQDMIPQREPQPAKVTYAPQAKSTTPSAARKGTAPASIIGKRYVTFFESFTNYGKAAAWFIVEAADNDSVLLKGIADGYDMKGKYDPATGQLTIPTGVVVGKNTDGVDIVVYNLLKSTNYGSYSSAPVVATFNGDVVTFADGMYGKTSTNLNYVRMCDIKGLPSNGSLKLSLLNYQTLQPTTSYEYPIIINKTASNVATVQGMANWLYGHNYKVKLSSINTSTNVCQMSSTTDTIDYYKNPSTGEVRYYFMRYRNVDTVNSVSTTPKFDIVNGDTTLIKAQKILFWGYTTATGGLTGYTIRPFEIKADYNLYNAPIANQDTVDSIVYQFDPLTLTATVTGCHASLTNANIPASVTYGGTPYTVTEIAASAFSSKKTITTLSIPNTIKAIGSSAFTTMSALKEVHLPDMRTWLSIPKTTGTCLMFNNTLMFSSTDTTKWGKVYFDGIAEPNPTDIEIPEGISSLRYAFYYYRPLKKIKFASSVTDAYYAFYYCTSLTSATLSPNLTSWNYCFYQNTSLEDCEIPAGVQSIANRAFYNASKLSTVNMHTGLKVIEQYAFYGNKGLTKLTLPSTLDSIGSTAFGNCSNITEVVCRATTPPAVQADAIFSAFASNATLQCPSESIEAYKVANGWKNFSAFGISMGVTDLDDDTNLNIPATYYTLDGLRVPANRLTPGIYIEKRGSKSMKIVIK